MHQENKINLSIVIPVFNEDKYLDSLFLDLKKYSSVEEIRLVISGSDFNFFTNFLMKLFVNSLDTELLLLIIIFKLIDE